MDIVALLERDGALGTPSQSPWPTHEGDVLPVDWSELFPSRGRGGVEALDTPDRWEPDFDDDFLSELGELAGSGSRPSDRGAGDWVVQPDVCAWYQPIHFHGLDWGIFIDEDCLLRLAIDIAHIGAHSPRDKWELRQLAKAAVRAAFATLFLHEQYHHKTESHALRLHVVERTPRYETYFRSVYGPLLSASSDDLHEEALANANSYRRLSTSPYSKWLGPSVVHATRAYLDWRFPLEPPGYRKAVDVLATDTFEDLEFLLKSQVQEGAAVPFRHPGDWLMAPRMSQSFFDCRSDIWTIVRPGASGVLPTGPAYPSVSTRSMVKALRQLGYDTTSGGKGSHVKLKADGKPPLIIPGGRKDLSPVVLRNLAKALGYKNAQQLVDELKV